MTIDYTGAPNWADCEAAAIQASLDHLGHYITVEAMGFTRYIFSVRKSMSRNARSDVSNSGPLRCYFLNGKRREFTEKQIIADQQDWR